MSRRATGDSAHERGEQLMEHRLYTSPFYAHHYHAGLPTRETVFCPKLEDAGGEHLKAAVAPFLIQYGC